MTIAFGTIGAKNTSGTTTISVDYPASPAAGDIAIAGRVLWDSAATATDESGWTPASDGTGGTGSAVDSHTTRARIDYRQLDGTESGSVTFDQGGTISGALGVMLRYTKDASKDWDVAFASGSTDATHGTGRSTSQSAAINLQTGDMLIAVVAVDTDTDASPTAPVFNTNSGGAVVTGTKTRRTSGAGVATGNDGNVEVFDALISSGGPQDCTMSFAMTTGTSQCGPVVWIRLREVTPTITGTGVATAPAATVAGAGTVSLTGAGTPTAPAATADGDGTISLTGAGAAVAPAATAAGSGTMSLTGTGAAASATGIAAGSGSVSLTGTGAAIAPAANASGAGSATLTGSGAATAPTAAAVGTGVVTAPPRDITITGRLLESPHSGSLVAPTHSGSLTRTYSGRLTP